MAIVISGAFQAILPGQLNQVPRRYSPDLTSLALHVLHERPSLELGRRVLRQAREGGGTGVWRVVAVLCAT